MKKDVPNNRHWVWAMAAAMLEGLRFFRSHRYYPSAYETKSNGRAYLHPTKGWRGPGTHPRGTNKRRVRV